jgi:hypothetical protein
MWLSDKKPEKSKLILIFLKEGVDYLDFLVYDLKYPYVTNLKL